MFLPELALKALTNARAAWGQRDHDFNPEQAISAVLNPPDGPSRLIGLPCTDALTEEAFERAKELQRDAAMIFCIAARQTCGGCGHTHQLRRMAAAPAYHFWNLVATACTFARQLPLERADIDAAAEFLEQQTS